MSNLWIAVVTPSCSGRRLVRASGGRPSARSRRRGSRARRRRSARRSSPRPSRPARAPSSRSTVSTVSMPRPEKPTGRRTWRHWTSACCFAGLRAGSLDPVGRQPARDARRGDDGAVVLAAAASVLLRRRLRLLERQRARHLRRGDDPGAAADEPRGDVRAVERQRADEAQRASDRRRRSRRAPTAPARRARSSAPRSPAAARSSSRRARGRAGGRRAGAARGSGRVELERVEQARLRIADVDGVQLAVRDREERVAVRLDDVGLVDALLLHVRAGVVDALLGRGRRRRAAAAPSRRDADRPQPSPYGPTKRRGLRLRVAEQLAARAEGDETWRGAASCARLGGRTVGGADESGGDEKHQRREERDAFSESPSPRYTSQRPERHLKSVKFSGTGNNWDTWVCLIDRVTKGAPNELALDHLDRRARARLARIFRPRPLLDRPHRAGD